MRFLTIIARRYAFVGMCRTLHIERKAMYLARNTPLQKHILLTWHPSTSTGKTPSYIQKPRTIFNARFKTSSASHSNPDTQAAPSTTERLPPALGNSSKDARLLIGFTCKVCKQRQHKTMSKNAYQNGVVMIQCDKCKNRHLIADNLGWFKDKAVNIEDIMKSNGEEVRHLKSMDLLDSVEASQIQDALTDKELDSDANDKKKKEKGVSIDAVCAAK